MRAFVTGSTGLLGNNLVRALLAQGHQVRALVRNEKKARRELGDTKAEIVVGDMEDVQAFAPSLQGVDVLFHTAAYFREYYGPGDHARVIDRINVEGTMALARAAHAEGVRKMVDTSSSGIIGLKPDGSPGDEYTPPWPRAHLNLYFRSKLKVESLLKAFSKETGLFVAHALPGWMFGPYDAGPTSAGQLVADALVGKLPPAVPPGGTSVADARDVAAGMVKISEKGRAGERYILSGPYVELADLFPVIARAAGVSSPKRRMPYGAAMTLAYGMQALSKLTGKVSPISVEGIRLMRARLAVDSTKAQRELGATFRPLEETIRDTVAWVRGHEVEERAERAA